MTNLKRHIRALLILAVFAVSLGSAIFMLGGIDSAQAHGKELTLTVSSLIPDRNEPLRRLYRVRAVYAGDLDLVEGADVVLAGVRREGGELLASHKLVELPGESGVYVGEVVFDRFGEWELQIDVEAALGQGGGSATLVESVTPVVLSVDDRASMLTEADRVQRLQVFFAFEWWPDIATITIRILHSLSAAVYVGFVGSVLLAAWLGGTGNRILTGWIGENFLKLASFGLGGILLSGLYGAAFDAPNAAPGIYEFMDLLELPYGDAYLAAFLLKPVGWIVMVLFALRVDSAIIKPAFDELDDVEDGDVAAVPAGGAGEAVERPATATGLKRLIWVGTALSIVGIADLAIVIYLHYLSHLGVFLPDA